MHAPKARRRGFATLPLRFVNRAAYRFSISGQGIVWALLAQSIHTHPPSARLFPDFLQFPCTYYTANKRSCLDIAALFNCPVDINYGNVYHSILTECSNQSAGIQLADYVAGAMYGYLRRSFIAPDNYAFATDLYKDYIAGKIRHNASGNVMGFGVREVPSHTTYRQKLAPFFTIDNA